MFQRFGKAGKESFAASKKINKKTPLQRRFQEMTACLLSILVRVGNSQSGEDVFFQRFHFLRFFIVQMVVTLCMQGAVDDQMGGMGFQGFSLFFRFPFQHVGTQDDVGLCHLFRHVGSSRFQFRLGRGGTGKVEFAHVVIRKSEYVGGVILFAVFTVQGTAFFGIDEAQGDDGRHLEGGLHPAAQFRARQGGFQTFVRVLDGE